MPAGSTDAQRVDRADLGPQRPGDLADDVDHVAVGLDLHQPLDVHGAVLAHAAEVVAAEVDEHHVLGALLLVGEQLGGDRGVVLAARAGAGDRAGGDVAAVDGQQRLGRGADDLEVLEVEEVHVRARVDVAQPAVDAERLDRGRRGPALRRDHLVGVAGVDVLDDPRDVGLEGLAGHVRLEGRFLAVAVRRRASGSGPARRVRTARIASTARAWAVSVGVVVVEVGVGEDRDRVAQVVEGDDHVGEHQRHVRQAEHVRIRLWQALDGAHAVEAEEADGAAGERRQAGDLGLAVLGDRVAGDRVRVPPSSRLQRMTLLRAPADERPAADLLALLGGLQQERGAVAAELEEGGDGRLAVLDEGVGDRDEVVVALEVERLLERRRDLQVLSDGGQGAPPRRP